MPMRTSMKSHSPLTARPRPTRAVESEVDGLSRTILDAMSAHIAILDERGDILETNRAWDEFALSNGMPPDAARRRSTTSGSATLRVAQDRRRPRRWPTASGRF